MPNNEFKLENINHSPLEAGQIQLSEFLNDHCPDFKNSSFLNPKYLKYDESINVKGHKRRLMEVKDYIAKVEIDSENKSVSTIPRLAGTTKATYVIDQIFNNRINKKPITYYEAKIIEAISGRESIMSISYVDLADNKSFKTKVNVFSTLKNDECTEFIATFISKNSPLQIEEYVNTGRIDLVRVKSKIQL